MRFSKKIDLRSRKEMTDYLSNHFRYDTMNPWNQSTSYANNMKIYNLGLDKEQEDKAWKMIDCDEIWNKINQLLYSFDREHDYKFQVGFNGDSGGYLVLYQGGKKKSEYKSICTNCGQKNFTSVAETGRKCGRCGSETRVDYDEPLYEPFVFPGKPIDMHEDFEDWDIDTIKDRVKLVCEFDKLCDDIVSKVIEIINTYEVEDEEYYIPKTRKVLVAKEG